MFYKIIFAMLFVLLSTLISCRDNTIDVKPPKDPRTYIWTADTLSYPGFFQTIMYDIWGSSPNDVYAVGHASANDGVMWHFDGNNWHDVVLSESKGGQIPGAFDLTSVFSFNSSDIYAAGERLRTNSNPPPTFIDSSLIIHYDGTGWRKVNVYNGKKLFDIYGKAGNDIWATGRGNLLYHFNGNYWEMDTLIIFVPDGYDFSINSISSFNSNYFLTASAYNSNSGDQNYYFIGRTNNNWVVIDSFNVDGATFKFGFKLNQSAILDLYSYGGGGIFKYDGASWINFFQSTAPISGMWAKSDNNIFAVGSGGRAFHYNGTDWQQIEALNDSQTDYWAVWTDGTEAFVAGSIFADGVQKTIVWHGK
ncbi:MAG: hypothetical protein IH619_04380 [Ignavibacterium sp.]|nr:hypothetical protein [Ignavibacterium sp.]